MYEGTDRSAAFVACQERKAGRLSELVERLTDVEVVALCKGIIFDILMEDKK
jgi:hypothetical protein